MLQPKKPAFDPTKPFEPAQENQQPVSKKPVFDPSKPYEAIDNTSQKKEDKPSATNKPKAKPEFRLPEGFATKLPSNADKIAEDIYKAPTKSEVYKKQKVAELSAAVKNSTQFTPEDESKIQERVKTEESNGGFWGGVKQGAIQSLNRTIDFVGRMADIPEEDTKSWKIPERKPFEEQVKQVRAEALKRKEKLTPEKEIELAKELFIQKEQENILIDKLNSFADNLDQSDKRILELDRYEKATHLKEENKKLLKYTKALEVASKPDIERYSELKKQVGDLMKSKQPVTRDLIEEITLVEERLNNSFQKISSNYDKLRTNDKDLGTAEQEYDIFKRENRDMVNFLKNVGVSTQDLGMGLYDFGAWYFYNQGGANQLMSIASQGDRMEMRKGIEEQRDKLRKPIESVESVEGFMNYVGDLVSTQIPNLATTALGPAGLAAIGASSTGKKFGSMEEEQLKGVAKYSAGQMLTVPVLYGSPEALSEIPTLSILKKGARVFKAASKNGGSELISKSFSESLKNATKDYLKDTSKELAGEEFTQLAQNFIDKFILGKSEVGLLDGTGDVFKDTLTLTTILKTSPHIGGAIARQFQSKDQFKVIENNGFKILELAKSLDNQSLTTGERMAIQKKIDALTEQSAEIMNKTVSRIGSMSTEQYNEVVRLNSESSKLKQQAKDIQINSNLQNKQELIDTLNDEYKKIQNRRESILNGAISTVEVLPESEQKTLRKQALEDLVTEKNPDGKPGIEFTEAEILNRANQIYFESKANEEDIVEPTQTSTKSKIENKSENSQEIQSKIAELENESAQQENAGVGGDVEATAKALEGVVKNIPIDFIEEEDGRVRMTGGGIELQVEAKKADKIQDVKTPSFLSFLPKTLTLSHLARNRKDKNNIIKKGFDLRQVSIDSPIKGAYFSSEDWSSMDRFGRVKEDSVYVDIDNNGLLYFDSAMSFSNYLKENDLPYRGETLSDEQIQKLKDKGVKGILLREDFASQSRNELIVIDDSIIKNISESPKDITKLPSSFSNMKSISEAYHKAKTDGTNPELVKAVEDLISKEQSLKETPKAETNEATPTNTTPTNENVSVGNNVVEQNGTSEQQNNTEQSNEVPNDSGKDGETAISKNRVVEINDGKGDFVVELDEDGNAVSITSKKTGKPISKLNNTKSGGKAKNANFSRLAAIAENRLTDNAINKAEKRKFNDARQDFVVTNEYEAALEALANGAKVSLESLQKEVGNKDSIWASDKFLKEKQPSIEVLSERIHSNYPELSQPEIRNALIDIISSFGNIEDVRNSLIESTTIATEKRQKDELFYFMGQLSEKDRTLVETTMEEDAFFEGMSYDEIVLFYEKQYGTEQERLEAEQQDRLERSEQPIGQSESGNTSAQKREGEGENQQKEVENFVIIQDRHNTSLKIEDIQPGFVLHRGTFSEGNNEGFNSIDADNGYGKKGGFLISSVIKKGAKILKLVKGDFLEYEDNESGIDEFYQIIGEKERNVESDWGVDNELSDITTRLWNNEKAVKKLKKAGIDIVIGNTIDGVDAFIVNKNAVEIIKSVKNEDTSEKSQNKFDLWEKNNPPQQIAGSFTEDSMANDIIKYLDDLYNDLDKFGNESLSMGIPVVVAKAVIQAMKLAVQAGKSFAQAIQAGIDELKNSSWYQSLNYEEQTKAENDIVDLLANGDRATKNQIYRLVQQNITEDEAYDKFKSTAQEQRELLENKKTLKEWSKKVYAKFVKRFSDRQYDIKRLLSSEEFKKTESLLVNSHGASGYANKLFESAYDKIYRGLNQKTRDFLDEIIQARRFITIDKNRSQRGLEPVTNPNFIDGNVSQKFLDKLKDEIGEEAFNDLNKRADEYFKTYSQILDQMLNEGFLTQEQYDSMNGLDYQPRVFLNFITDFNGDLAETKSENNIDSGGLSQDAVKSMKEGDDSALVLNSQWLLMNSLAARQKAIANNRVNKKFITEEFPAAKQKFDGIDPNNFKNAEEERFYNYFKELSEKVIENPVTGLTDSGNLKFKYNKTPQNFAKMYYWEDGQRKEFFLEQELHDAWNDNVKGFLKPGYKEAISYASGAALVKAIATGNNPAFPIVNTPRDFFFTLAFSDQYSSFVGKGMVQITKDVIQAIKEIKKGDNSDLMKKYFEYGGAMDFLSTQGTLKKDSFIGKAIEKAVDPKAKDLIKSIFKTISLNQISQYSELMFRLGLFQRSIKNQLDDLNISNISEVKDKETLDSIYSQAVADARGILDFNQGGAITKDLEAFIPYVNVAFQGGKTAVKSFRKNPVVTSSKILQIASIASGIPVGLSLMLIGLNKDDEDDRTAVEFYIDAYKGVSKYKKNKYMIIFDGTRNEDGEYRYWQIAKAQELSPVMTFTDNVTLNYMRSISGQEKKSQSDILKEVLGNFNDHVMPIDVTSPGGFFTRVPILKATLTYATGYDFFREEPLSMKLENKPAPWEGMEMKNVEEFYKKAGEKFGVSPVRSKAAVESFITTPETNPFIGMLYGGADVIATDKDAQGVGKKFAENIGKSVVKRIVGHTSEFNRQLEASKSLEEKLDKIKLEDAINNKKFKEIATQYANKEITDVEFKEKTKDLDPIDQKRLRNKIKDKIRLKDVEGAVLDIKYEKSAEARAVMILHYYGDIFAEENREILIQMKKAGGILTTAVRLELEKQKQELMKSKKPE